MQRLLRGAVAGGCAGLAMKAVVQFIDPHSFGLSNETDARTTHDICRRMQWQPISERRARQLGAAMHYGFAVVAGIAYAQTAKRFPLLRTGRGAVFGAALWLFADEWAVSATGLEDPFETPLASHVSALGAHVLFGMVVEAIAKPDPELK